MVYIQKCFDAFEDQGAWILVMEHCASGSLQRIIGLNNGLDYYESWVVAAIIIPLLITIDQLHRVGIVHRDIKPSNVHFTSG